jgi:NADH-quinone oxidoreductase subunit L
MTFPLIALAIAAVVAGGLGIQSFVEGQFFVPSEHTSISAQLLEPFQHALGPALAGIAAVALGLFLSWRLYANAASDPIPAMLPAVSRVLRNKFYFDELYATIITLTQDALACFTSIFDEVFMSGGVRLISGCTELVGRGLRLAQSGNLQTYALLSAAGIAVVLYFMLCT